MIAIIALVVVVAVLIIGGLLAVSLWVKPEIWPKPPPDPEPGTMAYQMQELHNAVGELGVALSKALEPVVEAIANIIEPKKKKK